MSGDGDVLAALLEGRFVDPARGTRYRCPVGRIHLAESLDGQEGELVAGLRLGRRAAVVADGPAWEVLGRRVALATAAAVSVVLDRPHADSEAVEEIRARTRHAEALIVVGAGTLTDLCKLAAHRDRKRYACFPTAPSTAGFVTGQAFVQLRGIRLCVPARPPAGAFFDLAVLRAAPARLVRAGIGACLARPFELGLDDEAELVEQAQHGCPEQVGLVDLLVRLLVLRGLAWDMAASGSAGTGGPQLVSHYIDALAVPHARSLHGEQVALACITLARLQTALLGRAEPPVVEPTRIDEAAMQARFGPIAEDCIKALKRKALDRQAADQLNSRLASDWPRLRARLRGATVPLAKLERAAEALGLPSAPAALGLDPAFYREALLHARALRDRYGILDLADDAGLLEPFAAAA